MQEGLKALEKLLDPYDWFYEAIIEGKRYIVYVTYMDQFQDTVIPDSMMGHQVLVHFAANRLVTRDQFVTEANHVPIKNLENSLTSFIYNSPIPDKTDLLIQELDRLERICGPNILESIFYEEHDGDNCVTNLSDKFPEVRNSLHRLYDKYGFDAIYNELEILF